MGEEVVVIFEGADLLRFKDPEFTRFNGFLGVKFRIDVVGGVKVGGGPVVDGIFIEES